MAHFCASPFWNDSLTWHTDDPDFTECFQKSVLTWIPFVFLCLMVPLEIYFYSMRRTTHTLKNNRIFCFKVSLLLLLCLASLGELGLAARDLYRIEHHLTNKPSQLVDLIAAIVQLLNYSIVMAFFVMDFRKHRRSSGSLFIFWCLLTFTEGIHLRSIIKHYFLAPHYEAEKIMFAVHVIKVLLIVIELVCSAISAEVAHDPDDEKESVSPEKRSTFLSQILFCWFTGFVYRGWRRTYGEDDIWDLNPPEKAKNVSELFERCSGFNTVRKKKGGHWIGWSLLSCFWLQMGFTILLKLIYNVMLFTIPEILRLLINFVKNEDQEMWKGYFFAVLLLCATIVQTLAMGHFFHHVNKLGLRIRTAVTGVIYRKVTRVAQFSGGLQNLGHPTNLISVDAQRLMDCCSYLNEIWEIPLQITVAMYMLWKTLGPSAFAGLGVVLISIPLGAGASVWTKKLQVNQMKAKDDRIKLTGEVFRSVKMLKLNAWEEPFQKRISTFRHEELRSLRTIQYLQAFSTFFSIVSPLMIAIVTFTTYVLIDKSNVLDSSKAFVALSIFNILKGPMNLLPPSIGNLVQAWVSTQRVSEAFNSPDPERYVEAIPMANKLNGNLLIQIRDGEFGWSEEGPSCLKKIDFAVRNGQLVGIVGQAGSGKTALCRALLGLLDRRGGTVEIKGNTSYMPQLPWLQSRSIRDNITFGRPFMSNSYETVLEKCALVEDLTGFSDGDDTFLSDQGSNLSGGQKQRICLARTIYGYAENFILDDPLSALDAKVAKSIFENVLGPNGLLKEKVRVVVMNSYRFLSSCDQLIVMENGSISEVGSFNDLLNRSGPFADFLQAHLRHEIQALHEDELEAGEAAHRHEAFEEICGKLPKSMRHSLKLHRKSISHGKARRGSAISRVATFEEFHQRLKKINSVSHCDSGSVQNHALFGVEKTASTRTRLQTFLSFIQNIKWEIFGLMIFTNALSTGFSVGSGIWLSEWAEENMTLANGNIDSSRRDFRLGVYAALGSLQAILFYISMMLLAYGLVRASKVLHHRMLHHLIRAPMWFFDTTPLGRITNRFSKDIDAIDVNVPQSLRQCLNSIFNILATVVILIYSYPLFAAFMVPIVFVYLVFQYFYISTSRQLKQLEATTRSPIFSHFQETLSGADIIRNFKQQHRFVREFDSYLDGNNRLTYLSLVAQRWLSIRLELIGNLVVFITAVMAVYGRDHMNIHSGHAGLSITYAVQVTQVLSWFVQKASDLEMSFISVERVQEYTKCPQEASWTIEKTKPPANWPSSGLIELRNYKTRYRPDLELTLKGITCRIHPDEKIGIVGRTGAGKSSLSLGIFRIVEPCEGAILIDGVDIAKLGLHDLRSRITIIPQEPLLLSGTLRENLDPANISSDAQIWRALEATQLGVTVKNLTGALSHPISEGGSNLSAGQRQLICLTRAILKKSKILVLDEATASLDAETDEIVQKTIQVEFADSTVLIIAHRIQSVMLCDRVMVLDKGQIQEFDSPSVLLKDDHGAFRSLADDANVSKEADQGSSLSSPTSSSSSHSNITSSSDSDGSTSMEPS